MKILHSPTTGLGYIPCFLLLTCAPWAWAAQVKPAVGDCWQVGTPIATYWAGPPLTDAVARQMVEGGFNLVWCHNGKELDVAHRHGLRGQLTNGLLTPASLDDPNRREQLDALVARVRKHPALYSYHLIDEPSAAQFPALGDWSHTCAGMIRCTWPTSTCFRRTPTTGSSVQKATG